MPLRRVPLPPLQVSKLAGAGWRGSCAVTATCICTGWRGQIVLTPGPMSAWIALTFASCRWTVLMPAIERTAPQPLKPSAAPARPSHIQVRDLQKRTDVDAGRRMGRGNEGVAFRLSSAQ